LQRIVLPGGRGQRQAHGQAQRLRHSTCLAGGKRLAQAPQGCPRLGCRFSAGSAGE
jgi:hypothetical protein